LNFIAPWNAAAIQREDAKAIFSACAWFTRVTDRLIPSFVPLRGH
jgi:hypothetical protein